MGGGGGGGGTGLFVFSNLSCMKFSIVFFFLPPPPPPPILVFLSFFLFVNLLILVFSFFFCILVLFVGCLSFFLLLFFCFFCFGLSSFFVVVVFFVCFFLLLFFIFNFFSAFQGCCFRLGGPIGFFLLCFVFFNQICRPMTPGDTHTYVVIADIKRYTSFSTVQILRTRIAPLIGKAFTITSISIHTTKTKSETLKSSNMTPSFSCPLPFQCGGGLRPGSFADAPRDCSTSQDFSPRTVEGT